MVRLPVVRLPVVRLPLLLSGIGLATGLALVAGRAGLGALPAPDPSMATDQLEQLLRWSPDPTLRREAALLLAARATGDPQRQRQLLAGQGWGSDPLAALVLKRQALAQQDLGRQETARELWQDLQRRFPDDPSSADALYALGRQQAGLRRTLLQRFPAHPAALAAALESGPSARQQLAGALHLARWGVRWPGAGPRLRRSCQIPDLPVAEREQLVRGLAELGEGDAAQRCLGERSGSAATELALAEALLRGDDRQMQQAEERLLALARRVPASSQAAAAARLLAGGSGAANRARLEQLPAGLRAGAAVQARLAHGAGERGDLAPALRVLQRWPGDPASWDLQWELARRALLQGRWSVAAQLLAPEHSRRLPSALAARQRFWLGYSQWRLGDSAGARRRWQELLQHHPGGYYGWRAAVRLGRGDLQLQGQPSLPASRWRPLASGHAGIDRLWRLDQPLEAWEHWRHHQGGRPARQPQELIAEGRLRRSVGDHWLGLGRLEQASLRLPVASCASGQDLERSLHELPAGELGTLLERAGRQVGVPPTLLAAVAKQESRFSPAVRSVAGAVGLLQLMPETAAELAGRPLSSAELEDPAGNAGLGARYLRQLLQGWDGNPWLAVASYNAGPGAVAGWVDGRLRQQPELWVEAIPYPETRLYVKKVLGNLWSLQAPRTPRC